MRRPVTLCTSLSTTLSPPPLPSPSGWPQIYSRGGVRPTRSTRRRPASCSECAKSPLSCNLTPPPRRRRAAAASGCVESRRPRKWIWSRVYYSVPEEDTFFMYYLGTTMLSGTCCTPLHSVWLADSYRGELRNAPSCSFLVSFSVCPTLARFSFPFPLFSRSAESRKNELAATGSLDLAFQMTAS